MTIENIKSDINTVIQALNNVEVKGLQNMDNVAGSIRILGKVMANLDTVLESAPPEEER